MPSGRRGIQAFRLRDGDEAILFLPPYEARVDHPSTEEHWLTIGGSGQHPVHFEKDRPRGFRRRALTGWSTRLRAPQPQCGNARCGARSRRRARDTKTGRGKRPMSRSASRSYLAFSVWPLVYSRSVFYWNGASDGKATGVKLRPPTRPTDYCHSIAT
jgi:hypothetical protein